VRYDLAIESPEYVKELANITPAVPEDRARSPRRGTLSKMMKPGVAAYDRFKELFDRYSSRPARSST